MKKTKPRKHRKPGATPPASMPTLQRIPLIDGLRGVAIVAMIAYHFSYDLNYLKWIQQDLIHDLRWIIARTLILGSFLLAVGASAALAEHGRVDAHKRWMRIGRIALAALLVTAGSWTMFPNSAIYFGTLHAIAVMSAILLLCPLPPAVAGLLGLGALALGNAVAAPVFNTPALAWIGLMTYKPLTEDYVPLLPWFGVCLLGYALMKTALARNLPLPAMRLPRWLLRTGQHSLLIYLLHQPILLGILIPLTRLLHPA